MERKEGERMFSRSRFSRTPFSKSSFQAIVLDININLDTIIEDYLKNSEILYDDMILSAAESNFSFIHYENVIIDNINDIIIIDNQVFYENLEIRAPPETIIEEYQNYNENIIENYIIETITIMEDEYLYIDISIDSAQEDKVSNTEILDINIELESDIIVWYKQYYIEEIDINVDLEDLTIINYKISVIDVYCLRASFINEFILKGNINNEFILKAKIDNEFMLKGGLFICGRN
jgi:hypothetical protein